MNQSIPSSKATRTTHFYILLVTQLILGIGGIQGGWRLIADPTGGSLGIPTEILRSLPTANFFLPGVFILLMFGIAPMFLAYALWTKLPLPSAEAVVKDYPWAWAASVGLSILLLMWTGILFCLLGYRIYYQLIDGLMGLVQLNLLLMPSVRKSMSR
ncbi:hypothetical protein [Larkinella humicola]|uniref:Uncharacterized protein n=1 Tax=Larkinella humicola TaxID=2607654 RepID=A0A5N1JM92_9BACT|nr:hypothetical protein [Larkinella humicola]KAA9357261.1 hypothetical protein F0P93_05865 [Larkinella humicola]